jgi:amino acid permease
MLSPITVHKLIWAIINNLLAVGCLIITYIAYKLGRDSSDVKRKGKDKETHGRTANEKKETDKKDSVE